MNRLLPSFLLLVILPSALDQDAARLFERAQRASQTLRSFVCTMEIKVESGGGGTREIYRIVYSHPDKIAVRLVRVWKLQGGRESPGRLTDSPYRDREIVVDGRQSYALSVDGKRYTLSRRNPKGLRAEILSAFSDYSFYMFLFDPTMKEVIGKARKNGKVLGQRKVLGILCDRVGDITPGDAYNETYFFGNADGLLRRVEFAGISAPQITETYTLRQLNKPVNAKEFTFHPKGAKKVDHF